MFVLKLLSEIVVVCAYGFNMVVDCVNVSLLPLNELAEFILYAFFLLLQLLALQLIVLVHVKQLLPVVLYLLQLTYYP